MTSRAATPPSRETDRPSGGRRAVVTLVGLAWALGATMPAPAEAQVFHVQCGTSSLHQATGGTLRVHGDGFDGWIGVGDLDRLRIGGLLRTEWNEGLLSVGDQAIPFGLPTDIFQAPHAFYGRGLGFEREIQGIRVRAIGGSTATVYGSPFFTGARSEQGAGMLFLDHQASPTVRVTSRSVVAERHTVISGCEWTPQPGLVAALAAGCGDGEPYAATSVRFERSWIDARVAWSAASDGFRRIAVPSAAVSEMERENVDLRIRPAGSLVVQLGRYHFLQPETEIAPALHGSVHQVHLSGRALGATTTLGLYTSTAGRSGNTGVSFGLTRPCGRVLELGGNVLHAEDRSGQSFRTYLGTLRESVSPHVDLSQVVTHTEGNTTVSFGGSYLASRFTFGAEWQTVYVPFVRGDPFRQALMLTLRFVVGDLTADMGSYVAPDGSVKYTLSGNQYLYRGMEGSSRVRRKPMSHHLVRGIVQDEGGAPVRGAAVRVDGDLVYTDSEGRFFVRKPRGKLCDVEVATGEFLTPLPYTVLSAPEAVPAQPEEEGNEVVIVVQRVRTRPAGP